MNKNVLLSLLGIALVAAGCNLTPQYDRPNAPVPTDWPSGTAYQDTRTATNATRSG